MKIQHLLFLGMVFIIGCVKTSEEFFELSQNNLKNNQTDLAIKDLQSCFKKANKKNGKPKLIIANTIKGKGCKIMENKKHWHYWNHMSAEEIEQTRKELA